MTNIKVDNRSYSLVSYEYESNLEDDLESLQYDIFGKSRIYIRIQKNIGKLVVSRPDGYLIDLASSKPKLYLIEAELSEHHSNHITSQLTNFKASFFEDRKTVMDILLGFLKNNQEKFDICQNYVDNSSFTSVDNLIDQICFQEKNCNLLLVIDEIDQKLNLLLNQIGPECIELKRYENESGFIHHYDKFKEGEITHNLISNNQVSIKKDSELDTVIVPRNPERDTRNVFVNEKCWYAININKDIITNLKYIAQYQKRPISGITHIAKIKNIEYWDGGPKYIVNFTEEAEEINTIELVPKSKNGKINAPQGRVYANYENLKKARNFDEVFYPIE